MATIKNLEMADMATLAVLYEEFWDEESDVVAMKRQFPKIDTDESYILLGAVEDGKLVGSATGIICCELYGECKPFLVLENMVVDPSYRGKGIARNLFEEIERRAIAADCSQIILVVEKDRREACRFYESVGFHPHAHTGYKKRLS